MSGRMSIEILSHGLIIRPKHPREREALLDFARTLAQWEYIREPPDWKPRRVMTRVYAGATKSRDEFRFHVNLLEDILRHLDGKGIRRSNIDLTVRPIHCGVDVEFNMIPGFEPRDYQVPIVDFFCQTDPIIKVTNLQTGMGKAQPLDAKIKVSGGWKTMGEMTVGQKVIAPDGTETTVTGVYPQGKIIVYKVTFSDGRYTHACGNHLWKVYCEDRGWIISNTLDMERSLHGAYVKLSVPLITPEDVSDVLPADSDAPIAGDRSLRRYIYSDIATKRKFLDSIFNDVSRMHYYTDDVSIATDFQYLIRSMGGTAFISEESGTYRVDGELSKGDGLLSIRSIEMIGHEEAQCISVDHPDHLYVTDDFIVTHNTAVSLMAMNRIGKRTIMQLRGGYIKRWLDDLDGKDALFKFKKGDIVVVRGRDSLISIINQAKNNDFNAKVIIISNKTLYALFKEYELNGKDNIYGIEPSELYELLGVGLRIIDEVHEDYHLSFRTDIYCHCTSSIHLSATLITEDPFRRQMYDIALPKENWFSGVDYDAYIDVVAYHHRSQLPEKIRTTERGRDTYSHAAYEKSIMRQPKVLKNYLDMIAEITAEYYFKDDWEGGQRALIFCSLKEMCVLVRDRLRKAYVDLEINDYVAETDESVLKTSDIIVSTVESCGTAQDIPGLRMSILTRALRKLETNEQVKGRLRKLKKWPHIDPVMIYLVNEDIPKHVDYHREKMVQFKGKVKSHIEVLSNTSI